MRRAIAGLLLLSALGSRLSAQPENGLQVTLITVGQGAYVWEKFGHNALWFHDPAQGIDVAYNWGIFDFGQPGFLGRFLTGDTKYWVEGYPGQALVDFYRDADRTVTVQRLNLTPEQAQRALAYSRWNAREENKYYRYDYFRDNCSTRVRDVIDYALGGALKKATTQTRLTKSYRSESVRLMDDLTLSQLGIYLALGRPADRMLTAWEGMFIPMSMRDAIRLVRVPVSGGAVPLVAQERVLHESATHRERSDAPKLWIGYLIVGLLLAFELGALGSVGEKSRVADVLFRAEVGLWAFLCGVLGLVLLLAWTMTRHVFWFGNANLLLLNPLSLFLSVLAMLSTWKPRYARPAAFTALAVAALGLLALVLGVVPGIGQDNLALLLLLLPAQVAIAFTLWRRVRAAD